jgi:XTP/dITP diphosphohydrolase
MQIERQAIKLILASNNAHKVKEIRAILNDHEIVLCPLSEFPEIMDPPETGSTFEANALQKARFVFERTGLPTIADDSGLSVDALNGAPGVHSKRYSKERTDAANNKKLLTALANETNRKAQFCCAIAIVNKNGSRVLFGQCHGKISNISKGRNGFGYDPLFIPDAFPNQHMAELLPHQKNTISHRGEALLGLYGALVDLGIIQSRKGS